MTHQYSPTPSQQALLIEESLSRGMGANNLAYAYRIGPEVDLSRFADCVEQVLSAAAPLADTFHRAGEGWLVQRQDRGPALTRRVLDHAAHANHANAEERAVVDELGREADRHMPSDRGPLFRVALLQGRFATYLTQLSSHLVNDSFTAYALTTAISALYNGEDVEASLRNLARGAEAFGQAGASDSALEQLRADLRGAHTMGTLTLDGQVPGTQQAGRFVERSAGGALFARFHASPLVQEWGAFPVLLAAHAMTCSIIGDRAEVVTTLPLANRRGVQQRGASGYFVNSLPVHLHVDELSTVELVATAAGRLRALQRYQSLDLSAHLGAIAPQLSSGLQPDNAFTAYTAALNFSLDGCVTSLLEVPRCVVNQQLTITVAIGRDDLVVRAGGPESVMVVR